VRPNPFRAPIAEGTECQGPESAVSGRSYAPNGDVLAMTDSVMGSWTYTYDAMNRLTSGTATGGADDGLTLSWAYDRYGNRGPRRQVFVAGVINRWSQTATGTGSASAVQPQLTFNGSGGVNTNRIDGWSYDNAGNLLNDKIHTYTYDAENRIATLSGEPEYIYDAEGRRVAKTNSSGAPTSIYILGLGGEQVTELNSSGAWVHSNVFAGGGRLLASYEGPAGTDTAGYHYHLTDWLGTKRMQTTASGNQEQTCMSYPFGDGLACTGGPDATEHHFTGKERDVESGLDYFEARYFTSDLARFMTPDWAAKPTAVPYAEYGNPQSLDLYQYMRNDPLGGVDPNGHCGADFCFSDLATTVTIKVATYVATHPQVAQALNKLGDSIGMKVSFGAVAKVNAGPVKIGAAVSLTSEGRNNGTGSSAIQGTAAASIGGVGGQANGNATFERNGSAVNPLNNLTGNAKLTASGPVGDNVNSSAAIGTDGRVAVGVGGTVGLPAAIPGVQLGVQGGVQVTAGAQEATDVASSVGGAIVQDTTQFAQSLQASTTCGSGGCQPPH